MSDLLFTLISIPFLTTGRRLFALKQCLELAKELMLAPLVTLIEEAILHDQGTIGMERAWTRSKKVSKARGNAVVLDNSIDGIIGSIQSTMLNHKVALAPNNPIVKAADIILSQLFPEGVKPIITLPFEEQLSVNDDIVNRLKTDLKEACALTGIAGYVENLETLNEAFRLELRKTATKETTFDVIEARQAEGNLFVRQVVALVLGTFYQKTAEASEKRSALLKPILDQCERLRQSRKGRRPAGDVDPDTGDELPSEEPTN
jgi:hypothetical protein